MPESYSSASRERLSSESDSLFSSDGCGRLAPRLASTVCIFPTGAKAATAHHLLAISVVQV